MIRILDQLEAGRYTVLFLEAETPLINYSKIVIDEREYKPVTVYDLPQSIAIEAKGDFVGKEIKFI